MPKVTPFLWFDGGVQEAVDFCTSLFGDSAVLDISHYPEGSPGPAGEVMMATFRLGGQEFMAKSQQIWSTCEGEGGTAGDTIAPMAMTLRLTDAESEALRHRAEHEGRSMQEVAREAVRNHIDQVSRRELLDQVLDSELPRYAEALERLGQ